MKRLTSCVLMLVLLALSRQAGAADTCSVTTSPMGFTGYNTIATVTAIATITVTCVNSGSNKPSSVPVTLAATAGNGSISQRQMVNGARTLNYNLYTDYARTVIWGNGITGSTIAATTSIALNGNAPVTIYGKLPGGQNVAPGNYFTTTPVVVTATY
jgi:spore coat protein U-like protein